MANPLRFLSPRAVPWILIGLTVAKIVIFFGLEAAGKIKPFVGANAVEFSLPVAHRLVNEGRFNGVDSRADIHYPPGYPFLLAVFLYFTETHFIECVVVIQLLSDLLTAAVLYWAGKRYCSWQAGLIATVVWLLFPPELAISTWVTQETIYTAILAASTFVLILSLSAEKPGGALAAGVLLGLATLFRPTAVYFPFFLAPLWLFFKYPRRWVKALLFVAGTFLVVIPWTIRNWVVLHEKILVSTGYGATMFQSSDERLYTIAGKEKWRPVLRHQAEADGVTRPNTDLDSEIDRWMLRVALYQYKKRWQERPLSFIPFYADRFFRLFYANESGALRSEIGMGLCSLFIVPLGAWQLWRWRNSRRDLALISAAVILYFVGIHWIVFPEYRYILPAMPWLILPWSQAIANWLFPDSVLRA